MNTGNKTIGFLIDEYISSLESQIVQLQQVCDIQQQEIIKLQEQIKQTRQSLGMQDLPSAIESIEICAPKRDVQYESGTNVAPMTDGVVSNGNDIPSYSNASTTTVYVMPSNSASGIVLSEVQEDYASNAQMCLRFQEDSEEGDVYYNEEFDESNLSYIEDFISPFFNLQPLASGTPYGADTITPGKAILKDGNWILEEKPTIKIKQ